MFKKISVLFALVLGIVFVLPTQQVAAATGDVFVDIHGPAVAHNGIYTGSSFQVDVVAEGITDPDGLAGGQFDLSFDNSILSVHTGVGNEPQIGPLLSSDCTLATNEAVAGVLSVSFFCNASIDISSPSDVLLTTIIFDQTAPPGSDTPIVFDVLLPFLNDGDITGPFAIDTPLVGVGDTGNIYVGDCGDQNDDQTINTIDATIDAFIFAGIITIVSEEQEVLSDVFRDGAIDVGDAVMILQHIVGLIDLAILGCGPIDPLA